MRIKHILLAFVALIVTALVGGYIYLSTLDFETLKAQLQGEVEKATGRQLTIDGPLDLAIGLQPAVAVDQVALSNADWGSRPQMVTLERFELELDLLSLLTGEVQVNRVVLVRPDILLETDPAGAGNWVMTAAAETAADETAAEGAATGDGAPADSGASGDGPLIPNIVAVEIEEGQFVYRDGVSGETTTLGLDSLTLAQAGAAQELDLVATFQGAEIALAGTIGAPAAVMADADLPIDLSGSVAGNDVSVNGTVATPLSAPTPNLTVSLAGESLASFAPLAGGAEIPPIGPYSLEGRVVSEGQRHGLEDLRITAGGSDLSGSASADLSGDRPQVTAELTAGVIDLRDFQAGAAETGGEAAGGAPAGESPRPTSFPT
ncbi:AsmA family protein [Algihabitans albus]|uniref:AsmA family protein n=1 Tax=Algihabitans albus TaxID=2164067 RepID=UPI0035CFB717